MERTVARSLRTALLQSTSALPSPSLFLSLILHASISFQSGYIMLQQQSTKCSPLVSMIQIRPLVEGEEMIVWILNLGYRKRAKVNWPIGGLDSYGVRWRKNGGLETTGLLNGKRSLDHWLSPQTYYILFRDILTALCSGDRRKLDFDSLGLQYCDRSCACVLLLVIR